MDTPKKILIDLGKLKNRYSGLGEVSYNFASSLSQNISLFKKENWEVYLLVPSEYNGAFGNEFKYVTLNFFRRHLPFLNKQYDLWHAIHQDSGYMPGNKKTKYLLTIHDLNFIGKKNKNKVARRSAALQKKISRASYITAISNYTKNEIQNHFQLHIPIEVIYWGVSNTNNIKADKPKGIPEHQKFYLHISTLTPKKNVMSLLDMMRCMPDKKLVIAGSWDNDYAKKILARIKAENLINIIPLSSVNEYEKAWLFQNCEAFFFPSYQEGFGLPVIEAMYCGKPVFASMHTSLPEIGSDKAFYWNNFEEEHMKDVVLEKMKSIAIDKIFSNELKKYAGAFTWQKNITRYIALFKELLS